MPATPIILLLGYTNVGKSSLFNTLLKKKLSITWDQSGVTRDFRAEICTLEKHSCILVDAPGFTTQLLLQAVSDPIEHATKASLLDHIAASDVILYMVEAALGLSHVDHYWIKQCHSEGKTVLLVVNKVDQSEIHPSCYQMDSNVVQAISVKSRQGLQALREYMANLGASAPPFDTSRYYNRPHVLAIRKTILAYATSTQAEVSLGNHADDNPKLTLNAHAPARLLHHNNIMLIGKPNVGKSTLTNQLVGHKVTIASSIAGTTRDIVRTTFQWNQKIFSLLDTAGMRRSTKIFDPLEKASIAQVHNAIKQGVDVIALLIDAQEAMSDQDFKLIQLCWDARVKLCIVVNKWDLLSSHHKAIAKKHYQDKLSVFPTLPIVFISASKRESIQRMMKVISKILATSSSMPTSHLTKTLYQAIEKNPPPTAGGKRIKPRFAHSTQEKFKVIITGNQVESLPLSYKRYLQNHFQKHLGIVGIDLQIILSNKYNPYQKNT